MRRVPCSERACQMVCNHALESRYIVTWDVITWFHLVLKNSPGKCSVFPYTILNYH